MPLPSMPDVAKNNANSRSAITVVMTSHSFSLILKSLFDNAFEIIRYPSLPCLIPFWYGFAVIKVHEIVFKCLLDFRDIMDIIA